MKVVDCHQVAAFMGERLAEEKALAERAAKGYVTPDLGMHTIDCGVLIGYWDVTPCKCGGPQRVLAEIRAKARVMRNWVRAAEVHADMPGVLAAEVRLEEAERAMVALVQVWADHPEFKTDWRL